MRTRNSVLKRVVGGGFAVAVASAFIVPGVASAEEADSGSLSGISAEDSGFSFGSVTDVLGCFTDSGDPEPAADGDENADDDGGISIGSVTTVIDCLSDAIGGGNGDGGNGDGGNGDGGNGEA